MDDFLPIIICEDPTEEPIRRVVALISGAGVEPHVFATTEIANLGIECYLPSEGKPTSRLGGVDLCGRHARVWWRRGTLPKLSYFSEPDTSVAKFMVSQYSGALWGMLTLPTALGGDWMNTPSQEALLDENKVLQHVLAQQAGLTVAPMICTDDPDAARRFVSTYGAVAAKPVSGFVMKTDLPNGREVPLAMFTKLLTVEEFDRVAGLTRHAPLLLEPYIEKDFELRITIVGQRIHACRIDSQRSERTRIDWRNYDLENTPHSQFELPYRVRDQLLNFMKSAGLEFAAIDMIVSRDGEFVFLEANPCGQYGWIESLTGLPISETIAEWLMPNLGLSD